MSQSESAGDTVEASRPKERSTVIPMNPHATMRSCLLALGVFVLMGCTPSKPTQDEVLHGLSLDAAAYSAMPTCQQIRVYADFGAHFLDTDHMLALTPSWMDEVIESQPKDQAAQCIADEGLYRLRLLAGGLNSIEDTSRSVSALIYKANQLKLVSDPQVEQLLDAAVCRNRLNYESSLVLIYYYGKFKQPPPYAAESDVLQRMRSDLCGP